MSASMLGIDGSIGEGGGQVLRTALSLSLVTGKPFHIENIRAGREKPGLLRQHLTAVEAAAAVGRANVEGASLGSQQLTFIPAAVTPGDYHFNVGSAGSATLVLQTVLPALLTAGGQSKLVLEGGTHNPMAPPFEFIERAFLPLINRMGPKVHAKLDRHGFYPAGSGKMCVTVGPVPKLRPFDLLERGELIRCRVSAIVANLPRHIAERELKVLKRKLPLPADDLCVQEAPSHGPGNAIIIEIEFANVTEVFVGFGQRGLRAEIVADRAAKEVTRYLEAGVPVGEHLADQLMLPFALAGGGSFLTLPLTSHAHTNLAVLQKFLDVSIEVRETGDTSTRVSFGVRAGAS